MLSGHDSPNCSVTRPTRPSPVQVCIKLMKFFFFCIVPLQSHDVPLFVFFLHDPYHVSFAGEGGTEEIGNMIQSYIKEIEDLR